VRLIACWGYRLATAARLTACGPLESGEAGYYGSRLGPSAQAMVPGQTTNLQRYDWLFTNAAAQARAANPGVQVFAEVSTQNGTTQQMVAAAQSISHDGFYVTAAPTGYAAWNVGPSAAGTRSRTVR
jgi:hypothetical protein